MVTSAGSCSRGDNNPCNPSIRAKMDSMDFFVTIFNNVATRKSDTVKESTHQSCSRIEVREFHQDLVRRFT